MNREDQKLDEELAKWRQRVALSPEQVDARVAEICRRVNEDAMEAPTRELGVVGMDPAISRSPLSPRLAWAAAACLAVAALTALAIRSGGDRPAQIADPLNSPAIVELARFGERRLAEKSMLADEMRSMFSGRFVGFVEVDNDLQIVLASDDRESEGARPMMAVRYLLLARRAADKSWSTVKTIDCVATSEENIEQATTDHTDLGLWVYLLDDGRMMIDSTISTRDGDVPLTMSSTCILKSGQSEEIYRQTIDGIEYRWIQTPAVLKDRFG